MFEHVIEEVAYGIRLDANLKEVVRAERYVSSM
jgi:hypothetical protein